MQCAVVIPVYKERPTVLEHHAFLQGIKILGKHPIVLACPNSMDISYYTNLYPALNVERFDDKFFANIEGYNRLMLSLGFYTRFAQFEYILIYQLDAWVFRDELDYWCSLGFDYIASPVHNFTVDNFSPKVELATLNGGFSLRRTSACIRTLKSFNMVYPFKALLAQNLQVNPILGFFKALFFYIFGNNTFHLLNKYDRNEDLFWASKSAQFSPRFNVAPVTISLNFGFDNYPDKSHSLAQGKLPFGCHAIDKNLTFWASFIPELKTFLDLSPQR